jgi:hypothetical protein
VAHPRCVGCGARAVHRHHVVYRQHCRRYGLDADAPENLVTLCMRCHFQHHRCLPKLPVAVLPEETVAWVTEQLPWYLDRFYEMEPV